MTYELVYAYFINVDKKYSCDQREKENTHP